MNILFVCTANTCRSAMAAALMAKIASDNDLEIYADSAGIFANFERANDNAIYAMKEYGIDLSYHISKPVTEELLEAADVVLTMTNAHKEALKELKKDRVFTIAEYAGETGDVHDPYGLSKEEYIKTAKELYGMLLKISKKV